MRVLALTIPLTLALLIGCGGPAASRKEDPPPTAAAGEPAARPAPAAPEPAPKATPAGAITRAEVMKHHKRGAGHFNALMRVKATFARGRFFGWRVLSYRGPGPIKPGDVIIDINGMPIEKPDQFMKVWEKLPKITQLTVKLLRDDKLTQLSYPVVD